MENKELKEYLINTSSIDSLILDLSGKSLSEVIDEMIKVKSKISPNYGKKWSSVKKLLKELEKVSGKPFMPIQVTDDFWITLLPYLINEAKLSISTAKTIFSQIKSSLNWGSRYGAKISSSYDLFKFPNYKNEYISLTPDEVSFIYHFNINTIPRRKQYKEHLERVRDMFVLSCNLGQRYSDMCRIDKSCFSKNIFTIVQQKTGNRAIVDIDKFSIDNDTVYEILDKYSYNPPFPGDISGYNKSLKQLLSYIGNRFNKDIQVENKVLGKIVTTIKPKLKYITSHTARRTFITINVNRGLSMLDIRKATGHQSQGAFERYICMK